MLSPAAVGNRKDDYHLVRTPGQLLSLTSHLSFRSPCLDRGASPVFNTPEALRDRRFKENSYCELLETSVGLSPQANCSAVSSDSFVALKRKFDDEHDDYDDEDEDQENPKQSQRVKFKIPRSGLTEIFRFANLTEDNGDSR